MDRRRDRLIGLAVFVPAAILLGLAAWLEPSPLGFGTHEQLGLSGCVMLTHTGIPCPMCGMTTTFALMMDLRWFDGVSNQPMGAVIWVMTLATAAMSLSEVVWPRSLWSRFLNWADGKEVYLLSAFFLGLCLSWAFKVIHVTEMYDLFS